MSAVVTLWQMLNVRQAVPSLLKKSVTMCSIWLSSERLPIFLTSVFCISIIFKYSSTRFGSEFINTPLTCVGSSSLSSSRDTNHSATGRLKVRESQGRTLVWIHVGFCCSFAVLCTGYKILSMLCKCITTELYPQPLCYLWFSRVSGTWLELLTLTP